MAELPEERPREVAVTGELSPNCVICNGGQTKQHLLPCLDSYGLCRRPECRAVVERASVTCTACQSGFRGVRVTVHHFANCLLKEEEVGGPYCWQCEKRGRGIKAAVCYCAHMSCFSYLCTGCQNSHATSAATENHTVKSLRRLSEDLRERGTTLCLRRGDLLCETHGKKLGRHCQKCKELICRRCSEVEPHRSHHGISDISRKLCEEMRERMHALGDRVAHQLQKVERALEHIDRLIAQLLANVTTTKRQINDHFDAMQAMLQARREQHLREVEQCCIEKTTALSGQRRELAAAVVQMRGFTANIDKVVSRGSVEDHFSLKAVAKQRSDNLVRLTRTLKLEPVRDDYVAYSKRDSAQVQWAIQIVGGVQCSKPIMSDIPGFMGYFHRSPP